jgi:hypothetical protein
MSKPTLTIDTEFVVGEEKLLNYIIAFLFLGLFLYGLVDVVLTEFSGLQFWHLVFLFALVPTALFLRKARSKRIYIRVNRKGIYQDEQLVTNWANLLNAYVTQKKTKYISIRDNFILVVEYLKEGSPKGFRRKIPLTNTQNKSEEDVLAAVKFFWKQR